MKPKLNSQKVKRLKAQLGFTWDDMARLTGLKSRQAVYHYIYKERANGAKIFAKLFGVKTSTLIK